jgi:biopolymer transport protein ExbD
MAEINMVPFIDVMLVLLIIFMVTAPMISTGIVDLPTVGKAAQRPADRADRDRQGRVAWSSRRATRAASWGQREIAAAVKQALQSWPGRAVLWSSARTAA